MVLFGTQVLGAGVGVINGFLLARLLGPAGKGDYYILVLVPSTAMVLLQLGLPQAFGYFAARGRVVGMVAKAFVLTTLLTGVAILAGAALLPLLRREILHGFGLDQILFAFLAFPLALNSTLTTGVVTGRQAVRWYAGTVMANQLSTSALLVAVTLGGLALTVNGAIAIYLIAWVIYAAGFALGARRAIAAAPDAEPASYRDLFGYGLPFFPGSLAGFFSARVDVFLLALLMADVSEKLGYYSIAVGLAEMVFLFPRAVSTLFFPLVAGSPREESDGQVAIISRVTLLVTGGFAILLIPAAAILLSVFLPAFRPSFLPLLVLLPGVVALSAANVVGGYLAGIGRPGLISALGVVSLAANVVANLLLIPQFGIIGASAASLVSYSLSALLLTGVAAGLTRTPIRSFWLPRGSDVRFTASTIMDLLRRVRNGSRVMPGDPEA